MNNGQVSQSEWVREALLKYEGPLVRYAQRITGELELARDVVQETFLKLCRQERAEVDGHLSQWLFTVCRNRALDVQRKERRMTTTSTLDDRTSAAGAETPGDAAEQKDSMARVLQQLDRLQFQNELSYREISEITGLTVSNVGFLLHVGLKRLRELMQVELA